MLNKNILYNVNSEEELNFMKKYCNKYDIFYDGIDPFGSNFEGIYVGFREIINKWDWNYLDNFIDYKNRKIINSSTLLRKEKLKNILDK